MTSTGNDIVCINAIDIPRTKQLRFYSRILSSSEQNLYNKPEYTAIPFEYFVWLLWSIKESAFKYLQRATPPLVFSPTKFIVTQLDIPLGASTKNLAETEMAQRGFGEDTVKAIVTYADVKLSSRSLIYRELIVSVVNGDENFEDIYWGVKSLNNIAPDYQSAEVRVFLTATLKHHFGAEDISICKTANGIPFLSLNQSNTTLPVSLSHHGNFAGYSFRSDK
jgi:phosphopantetheinyl transferase (holo-ACP synthase)